MRVVGKSTLLAKLRDAYAGVEGVVFVDEPVVAWEQAGLLSAMYGGRFGVAESGPMSYNLLCAAGTPPEALAPRSAALGLVRGVRDAATDALYGGPDCRAYEAALRAAGVYADIVGVDGGTICSDKWS